MQDPDSVLAVTAARDALLAAQPELAGVELSVTRFARDTAGFLIDLAPLPLPDSVPAPGGTVRVSKDGRATVVRGYRTR